MDENLLTNDFEWDGTDLRLINDSKKKRICGNYLSPTQGEKMEGCSASMAASRLLPFKFDVMAPNELGNVFHYIMENLFDMDPEDRVKEEAFSLLDEVEANGLGRNGERYKEAFKDPVLKAEWRASCERNINGYFEIEDPTSVRVVATELDLRGIEVGGVPFNGKIDRLDETPSGALQIRDYKTGKFRDEGYGDPHGNQLRLYKAALAVHPEYKDRKVTMAELLYVTAGQKRRVKTAAREVEQSVKQFQGEWEKLQSETAAGTFPTQTSILCKWCPLVFACPAAQGEGITNIHNGESVGEPYSPNELGIRTAGVPTQEPMSAVQDTEQIAVQMGVGEVPGSEGSQLLEYPPSVAIQQFVSMSGLPPHEFQANIQAEDFRALEDHGTLNENVPPVGPRPTNSGEQGNHERTEPVNYQMPQATHQDYSQYVQAPVGQLHPQYGPQYVEQSYQAPQPAEVQQHRPYREAKAWEGTELDGHINTASYEFGASMRLVNLALYEVMQAHIKPTGAIVTALARTFENILAKAEFQISGSVDTGLKLHGHMRGVLADNLAYIPVPWTADANTWQGWSDFMASRIANMVNIALTLTKDPQPSPETPAYAPLIGVMASPWEQ